MKPLAIALALVASACIAGTDSPKGPPTAYTDLPPPCSELVDSFLFDVIAPETSVADARDKALDIDGDGHGDNRLGELLSVLAARGEQWRTMAFDGAIELERCGDAEGDWAGMWLDFDEHQEPYAWQRAQGVRTGGDYDTWYGRDVVPLGYFFTADAERAGYVQANGVAVVAHQHESRAYDGALGFGVERQVAIDTVIPLLADTLSDLMADDPACPGSACPWSDFDPDSDGVASIIEVSNDARVIHALQPTADLFAEVDGEQIYSPGGDGVADSVGLSVRFFGVP